MKRSRWDRIVWLVMALCAAVPVARGAAVPPSSPPSQRVVAVGDIHGAYDALVEILQTTGLIDEDLGWSGGSSILVQTGDFLDRGREVRKVMDLLMGLQRDAPRSGGQVIVLLGNHEGMNLAGALRDVNPLAYESFVDADSRKRQRQAFQAHRRVIHQRARATGRNPPLLPPGYKRTWLDRHPPGFVELNAAMAPEGVYGRWLRGLPAAVRVGDAVFLHGGISPQLATWTVEEINDQLTSDIEVFDHGRQSLIERQLVLPFSEPGEVVQVAYDVLSYERARIEKEGRMPSEEERAYLDELELLVTSRGGHLFDPNGPLWFRGFASWSEEEAQEVLPHLLATHNVRHLVTAHTPQRGHITQRFAGRIFLIDTGMLSSVYRDGRASALEIEGGRFTAIYPDQKVVLLDKATQVHGPARATP